MFSRKTKIISIITLVLIFSTSVVASDFEVNDHPKIETSDQLDDTTSLLQGSAYDGEYVYMSGSEGRSSDRDFQIDKYDENDLTDPVDSARYSASDSEFLSPAQTIHYYDGKLYMFSIADAERDYGDTETGSIYVFDSETLNHIESYESVVPEEELTDDYLRMEGITRYEGQAYDGTKWMVQDKGSNDENTDVDRAVYLLDDNFNYEKKYVLNENNPSLEEDTFGFDGIEVYDQHGETFMVGSNTDNAPGNPSLDVFMYDDVNDQWDYIGRSVMDGDEHRTFDEGFQIYDLENVWGATRYESDSSSGSYTVTKTNFEELVEESNSNTNSGTIEISNRDDFFGVGAVTQGVSAFDDDGFNYLAQGYGYDVEGTGITYDLFSDTERQFTFNDIGSTVTDYSVNEIDADNNGVDQGFSGIFNSGYADFRGNTGYFELGDQIDFSDNGGTTISGWVNYEYGGGSPDYFYNHNEPNNNNRIDISIESSNQFRLRLNEDEEIYSNSVPENEWVHLAFVIDEGNEARIYQNGNLDTSESISNTFDFDSGMDDHILGTRVSHDRHYEGYIDEFTIFDNDLSSQEVENIYNTATGNMAGASSFEDSRGNDKPYMNLGTFEATDVDEADWDEMTFQTTTNNPSSSIVVEAHSESLSADKGFVNAEYDDTSATDRNLDLSELEDSSEIQILVAMDSDGDVTDTPILSGQDSGDDAITITYSEAEVGFDGQILNPLNNAEFSASETEEDLNDDIEFENQLNPTDVEEDLTFTGVVTSPSGDTWTAFDNENRQTPTGTAVTFSGMVGAYEMVKDNSFGFDTEQNFGQYEYQIYWKEGHDQNVDENDFDYTDGPNSFTVDEVADRPEINWDLPVDGENFVIDKFDEDINFDDSLTTQRETFFNQPLNGDTYVIQEGETLDFEVVYSSRTSAFDEVEDIELWIDDDSSGFTGPTKIPISGGTLDDGESYTFTFEGNEHTIEVVSRDRDATPSTVDVLIDGAEQTFEDGEKISLDEFDSSYTGSGDTDQGWVVTVVSTTVFNPYHEQQTIEVDEGLTEGTYELKLEEYPNDEFSDTITINVEEETLADVDFEYDLTIDEDEADTGIEFREGSDSFSEIFSDTVTSSGLVNHEETGLDLGEYEYFAYADTETHSVQSETRTFTVTDEPLVNEVGISLLNPDDGQVFNVNEGETQEVEAEASIDTTDYDSSDELTLNWILDGTTDATQTISGGEELTESIIWGLGAGTYDWSVEVVDPDGQSFSSETRTFEISEEDTTVDFDILSPSEGEQFLLNEEVLLSSTVEANVDGSKYHVVEDSTGSVVFETEETYLTSFDVYESSRTETFSEGDYSYYNTFEVDGSDSVYESSSVGFSVLDIDSPEIDLVDPEDGSQVVTNGSDSFTVDFEFSVESEKTGDVELMVRHPGNEEFELVESFSYTDETNEETFEASQLFEEIEYPNEVNNILESDQYEWKVTFENEEFEIDYETSASSWTFVEEEITTATGIVDRVLNFFRGYWEALIDGTTTTGKAFMGLVLMLVAGAIGFSAAGSIGAGFGMAAMFLVNTLVGLFPGWIVLALVIGGLAYVLIMRGD